MNPAVRSFAKAITSNGAYLDLKVACYESSASKTSHEAVRKLLQELEGWAEEHPEEATPLKLKKAEKPKEEPYRSQSVDPDLSDEYDPNES